MWRVQSCTQHGCQEGFALCDTDLVSLAVHLNCQLRHVCAVDIDRHLDGCAKVFLQQTRAVEAGLFERIVNGSHEWIRAADIDIRVGQWLCGQGDIAGCRQSTFFVIPIEDLEPLWKVGFQTTQLHAHHHRVGVAIGIEKSDASRTLFEGLARERVDRSDTATAGIEQNRMVGASKEETSGRRQHFD